MCYRVSNLDAPLCAHDNIRQRTKIAARTNEHTIIEFDICLDAILITL